MCRILMGVCDVGVAVQRNTEPKKRTAQKEGEVEHRTLSTVRSFQVQEIMWGYIKKYLKTMKERLRRKKGLND